MSSSSLRTLRDRLQAHDECQEPDCFGCSWFIDDATSCVLEEDGVDPWEDLRAALAEVDRLEAAMRRRCSSCGDEVAIGGASCRCGRLQKVQVMVVVRSVRPEIGIEDDEDR